VSWRLALVAVALPACAVLVHPTDAHVAWAAARWPDVTLAELEKGRTTYVDTCSGCHTLPRPESRAPDDWPDKVREMETDQDVHLGDEERRVLLRYLEAAAALPAAR
jgi:hypothetical protein